MDENDGPIFFGEWLKLRRKALDMTQAELAARAGCSLGALRKIELGDRRPSKQLAKLLAKALEIPEADQQNFVRIARGELGLDRLGLPAPPPEPLPAFSEIYSRWQTQHQASPESRTSPASSRIPIETTPIIGRTSELTAIARLFNDPRCRLLTLTGVGGIGKTRLAIEFALSHAAAFPGGVFYFPLTSVNSPEKIFPAIADVLNFGFSGPSDPKEQLLNYLSGHIRQKALFVFDNLEHLLVQPPALEGQPGVVDLISEILRRLPLVSILGTSRERLDLHGEWTYELHGLSVPPPRFTGRLEDYNAIALFVTSAQRIKADFQVTAEERPFLIRICQLVEGVPLAIELAAAWVRVLSCQEIAQEIQANMDILSTTLRDIPERHRSIRATFDHSWKLLTKEECRALCQLSIFQGGFDREAADQIAGASLPLLASLSAKSLVRRSESGRYDLHEVIRQYALAHLHEHSNAQKTYARHCEYYLTWLSGYQQALKSAQQQEALRRLTDEIDNLRAAWGWAIEHKKYAHLGQAGRAFGWYFEISGLYQDGLEQLERLIQSLKAEPPGHPYGRVLGLALIQQALLYFRTGRFAQAASRYAEGEAVLRPVGDPALLADALIYGGTILHLKGDYTRARSLLEEGRALAQTVQCRWLEAYATINLGYITGMLGCYEEGYEQMLAGLAMFRTLGDPHAIALAQNFLVPILNILKKYAEAKAFLEESLALCEATQNRWGMGTAYGYLGLVCISDGEYAAAKEHLHKSLELFGEYITGWNVGRSLTYLGHANRLDGDFAEARKNYLDVFRLSLEAEAIPIVLDALSGLAYWQEQAGHLETALLLTAYVSQHPSSEDESKARAEELCQALEARMTPGQVRAARANAAEMTFEEIKAAAMRVA